MSSRACRTCRAAGEIVARQRVLGGAGRRGRGGRRAARQARRPAATFLTALGDDELGRRVGERAARSSASSVHAAPRAGAAAARLRPRSTTTASARSPCIGERIVAARRRRPAVGRGSTASTPCYFTGGDAGALRAARPRAMLVATPRAAATLHEAGVQLDALVHSGDRHGRAARATSSTRRRRSSSRRSARAGGRWEAAEGRTGTLEGGEARRARASTPTAPATRSPPA